MLSSNNHQELFRKQEPKRQRFTIKKLTVGVASVLIGFTFMGLNAAAKADTQVPAATSETTTTATSDDQAASTSKKNEATTTLPKNDATNASTNQAATLKDEKAANPSANATTHSANANASEATPVADSTGQTATASDAQGLINGLNDANVGTININSDINLGTENWWTIDHQNAARHVVINGNGHTIDFGKSYLYLKDATQSSDDAKWNLEFKNMTIRSVGDGTHSKQGIVYTEDLSRKHAAEDTVTFNGVTTTNDTQVILWNEHTTNVVLKGNNTLNSTINANNKSAIFANRVDVIDGTTTTNVKFNNPNNGGTQHAAFAINITPEYAGNFTISNGATLNINGSDSVMGIRFLNWAKTANIDDAKTSVVHVNGNLNMNMGKGASTAILASYVDVTSTGVININTKQDCTDGGAGDLVISQAGTHFGVIAGGIEASDNYAGIRDAGTIKISREGVAQSNQPLISYGDATLSSGKTFTIDVKDGAILNLSDSAQNTGALVDSANHRSKVGLITMWGTSGTNVINIDNPKYVNLQRTGAQSGNLLRLEGSSNDVWINHNKNNAVTPVEQWLQGNTTTTPNYVWYLESEHNQNPWGDKANQFIAQGQHAHGGSLPDGVDQFYNSNGQVAMAANQAGDGTAKFDNGNFASNAGEGVSYQTPYLNQFLNNFSWWKPQRLAMGTELNSDGQIKDDQKYQPEVQTINATTDQTLNDLQPINGIKDLIGPDGKINKSDDQFNQLVNKVE
ncbi:pectate lyase-like adhesive domain-containing protein [uncultured Limosilactobacillus sp.]|uniref:pectate lyase-like adhesive domain-containing protein n=1 Tax=uncultured Limosilactobacillus sp. TaxID=2837629 RepID=UPI0025DF5AA0|nr:pectate lyase-like adhesive domain-containing protein [uncultured Limosilactobacillus sp.]